MTLDLIISVGVWLLGLCVGSFLNVVIYRLPSGLSIASPARSFCPHCRVPIAWYDNIPVLSWIVLGARCRRCHAPISAQYPLVEALTGLVFVLVYYLLFVVQARAGAATPTHPYDWPLLGAWLVLAAALIACSAMDVVSYMLDVRITIVAVVAGIVLNAAWPRTETFQPLTGTPWAAGAVAALLVSVVMLWLTVWRGDDDEEEAPKPPETAPADPGDGLARAEPPPDPTCAEHGANSQPASRSGARLLAGGLAIAVFVALTVWALVETGLHGVHPRDTSHLRLPHNIEAWNATPGAKHTGLVPDAVVPAVLLTIFATVVLVGGQRREADAEVSAAIEEEEPQARRAVLGELAWLAPSICAGVLVYAAVQYLPQARAAWQAAGAWSPGGEFTPVAGAVYAIFGAVVAAAVGWLLRIGFTLVFGREALGTGDIYILAAAGATAGWDIALLGMVAAVGVAIAGFVLGLLLKRTGIIAFGPWLALGFVVALWQDRWAAGVARYYYTELSGAWVQRPDVCFVAGGIMLLGSVVAIVLALLVRRAVPTPSVSPAAEPGADALVDSPPSTPTAELSAAPPAPEASSEADSEPAQP